MPLIVTSSDLITFSTVTTSGLPGSGQITSVAYSSVHDYFFLTINAGDVYKSSDGAAWSVVTVDDVGYIDSTTVRSSSTGDVFLNAQPAILAQYGVIGDQFTTIGTTGGSQMPLTDGVCFGWRGRKRNRAEIRHVTETDGGDEVTPTPITDLSPVTPSLALFAEATGSAQSSQQLFIKSDDQAWIYTE
ncbi:MAG: hypothetical protein IPH08_05005 [Rhodocyclaceae bacterium]|nr:hypothetical protein [Rhodocyclaceae bacterium]